MFKKHLHKQASKQANKQIQSQYVVIIATNYRVREQVLCSQLPPFARSVPQGTGGHCLGSRGEPVS